MTLFDLAQELNVSISTISRSLSRPEMVARLTREKVLAAIDAHIAALQTRLEAWNSGEATQTVEIPPEMRDFVRLSFANGREHMEVDLRFLRTLRERLPALPHFSPSLPSFDEEHEA